MTGFSADWLSLREPVDRRSRNREILAAIAARFHDSSSVTVTDLACGRGSLMRALREYLPERQHWRLVDHDRALLDLAEREQSGTIRAETRSADLALAIEELIALKADLVASSALIDLVSEAWLGRLARSAAEAGVPVYLALAYDGHVICHPRHRLDDEVMAAFHRHQQGDKGFGAALGPQAGATAARQFADRGFRVTVKRADWRLDQADRPVQERMICGWFDAVSELGSVAPPALEDWRDQRLAWIEGGEATMVVGHLDLWAVPPGGVSA